MRDLVVQLERDLRRIAALLRCAVEHLARGEVEPARTAFTFASLHLRHQLRFEDELLYPEAERQDADPEITRRLRCEHEVMRSLQAQSEESLTRGEIAIAEGDVRELLAELSEHQDFQRSLYPFLDHRAAAA